MSEEKPGRSAAVAAGLILVGAFLVVSAMPSIVLFIGRFSPMAGALAGMALLSSFFLVFWLRARYQRRHDSDKPQD